MHVLGDLTPAQFLKDFWQKRPLLVRNAVPQFSGVIGMQRPIDLARLAGRSDVVARIVTERKGTFVTQDGPFSRLTPQQLPQRATLLVQGVEAHAQGGWDLLARFNFIATSRIDDLMVSYAGDGAGVGPHFDLYDVFLLQGLGARRWKISTDPQLTLGADRAIEKFTPTDEWVLHAGDLLYLPPRVAHWGIAVGECMTYSIGFVAPTHEQLVHNYLAFLAQEAATDGHYQDPDLQTQAQPAQLSTATIARVTRAIDQIPLGALGIESFTGRLLTGPKPWVKFARPKHALSRAAFAAQLNNTGAVTLALASRMLFCDRAVFINAQRIDFDDDVAALRILANTRKLATPVALSGRVVDALHAWYRSGFVLIEAHA